MPLHGSLDKQYDTILGVLRKLILKETFSSEEWQNLFYDVHVVCSWDGRGPERLLKFMRKEIDDLYISIKSRRLSSIQDSYQQLKEYCIYWPEFKCLFERMPLAFQQLDLATKDALLNGAFHAKQSESPVLKNLCSNKNIKSPTSLNEKRTPTKKNGFKYSTVRCLMLKKWADDIISPFFPRLLDAVMNLIANERNGLIVETNLIVTFRESLSYLDELSIIEYNQDFMGIFEQHYMQYLEQSYSSSPDEYLRKYDIIKYIQWSFEKLDREETKAKQYLEKDSTVIDKVIEASKKCLINNHVEQLIDASKRYVLRNDIDSMHLIFKFLDKVDKAVERLLKDEFRYHIIVTGQVCMNKLDPQETGNPDVFVEKLLEVHNKFDDVVNDAFNNDARARRVFERSMGFLINDPGIFNFGIINENTGNESKCPEILANYCNMIFRKSAFSRKLGQEDLSIRLNELYLIIKLLKNKDSFLKTHKSHLMRRLILDASINIDREEEFILSLKDISGMHSDEINELLRMFKDLKCSDMLNRKFMKSMKPVTNIEMMNNNNTITDITSQITDRLNIQENNNQVSPIQVKVLNPSAWAKNLDRSPMNLPYEVSLMMPSFEAFYKSEYEGRELEWCHQLSNGVISIRNKDGNKYDIEVTAAQLSILGAFNENPSKTKTFVELQSISCLNPNEIRRTLWVS